MIFTLNMSLYPIGPLFIAKWGPDIRGRKRHAPQWWPTSTHQLSQVGIRNMIWTNDDVIKWKHFPRYWPFVRGIRWIPRTKARDPELWFSLICAWINGWVNNGEAGDLRCHRAHYDVTVMQEFGQVMDTSYVRSLITIPSKCTTTLICSTDNDTALTESYISRYLFYLQGHVWRGGCLSFGRPAKRCRCKSGKTYISQVDNSHVVYIIFLCCSWTYLMQFNSKWNVVMDARKG